MSERMLEVRCLCGRLLMRIVSKSTGRVQTKCTRCKLVNEVRLDGGS